MSSLLDPFALQDSLPGDPLSQCPEQAKTCPLKAHGGGFADLPLNFTSN